MAALSLVGTDIELTMMGEAFGGTFGYEPMLTDDEGNIETNPESEQSFMLRKISEWIVEIVDAWQRRQEMSAAAQAFDEGGKSGLVITHE